MKNQFSKPPNRPPTSVDASRRKFIQRSGLVLAGGAIGGNLAIARSAHAFASDTIKIGLIGCGIRGTAAVMEALRTEGGGTELVAMADVFDHQLQRAFRTIKGRHAKQVSIGDRRFVGLDGYRGVMESDADLVILATPPAFRPPQFEAAVQAGKHVFMEKPVATDATGVRRILAANEIAKTRGLAVQVGLQRRHELRYRQCIEKLQQGAIGDLLFARAYWNAGRKRSDPSGPCSELEFQLRNWRRFTWLAGDHINEQHIHNLDVINWLVGAAPIEANGLGGFDSNDQDELGQDFNHHAVEFTYPGGFRLISQCRNKPGCWTTIGEYAHGANGSCDIGNAVIRDREGKNIWQSGAREIKGKGWQQEQNDLFAAMRRGEVPNEGDQGAVSTMTAILGRSATYTGRVITWKEAINDPTPLANPDAILTLDDSPPVLPSSSGSYAVAVPGKREDPQANA